MKKIEYENKVTSFIDNWRDKSMTPEDSKLLGEVLNTHSINQTESVGNNNYSRKIKKSNTANVISNPERISVKNRSKVDPKKLPNSLDS